MTNLDHVLITGASTGIGLELARLFAADGRSLVLVARGRERLESVSEQIESDFGVTARAIPLDLTAPAAISELTQILSDDGIGIATLINNAGFGAYGPFGEGEPELYRKMIDLNVGALTELAGVFLPAMKTAAATRKQATDNVSLGIMNVASTAAFQPGPSMAVYFATKSYVLSFSEALHEELSGSGVLACAFCPGPTKTEFFMTKSMVPAGVITDADRANFEKRDAKRMNPTLAAHIGYEGFMAGDAIVIPGTRNSILSQAARFLPRVIIRKIVKRMLAK
jgi:uncharacterized protein